MPCIVSIHRVANPLLMSMLNGSVSSSTEYLILVIGLENRMLVQTAATYMNVQVGLDFRS